MQFQFQFQFVSFPQKKQSCILLQAISRKIFAFSLHFILGPFFKGSAPPSPRFWVNSPTKKSVAIRFTSPDTRGFNEPDIHHQAAMNPWHAAAVWPEVERVARNYGVQTLVSALMAL